MDADEIIFDQLHKMKTPACKSGSTAAESRKVNSLVKNENALIRAKEKELLEKYK